MIIFDFEWNRGYDKKPLDEILQIGAVRVDRLGGPVTDTFNVYIRPVVHKKFDPGAKKLPELEASRRSQVDFPTAMECFRTWCGTETVFAAWGNDDLKTLERNCAYWNVPPLTAGETLDLQRAFSCLVGTGQQVALQRAVEYCGIPDAFDFHDALYDSFYTSVVAEWITPEALTASTLRELPQFCQEPFPVQPSRKVGPFAGREEALNARISRRPACPLCGRRTWVLRWHGSDSLQYLSPFLCREHGRFLCRLTLAQTEDGRWQGGLSVPELTQELLQEYRQTLEEGTAHRCKSSGQKRKHHRKRHKAAQTA